MQHTASFQPLANLVVFGEVPFLEHSRFKKKAILGCYIAVAAVRQATGEVVWRGGDTTSWLSKCALASE